MRLVGETTRARMRASAFQVPIALERDLVDTVDIWIKNQGISGLTPLLLETAQIPEYTIPSKSLSLLKANPVVLNTDILIRILEEEL